MLYQPFQFRAGPLTLEQAAALTALSQAVGRLSTSDFDRARDLPNAIEFFEPFPAQITLIGEGVYSWREMVAGPDDEWLPRPLGRSGAHDGAGAAREAQGFADVPLGSIVLMHRDYLHDDDEHRSYVFWKPPPGSPIPAKITSSGAPSNQLAAELAAAATSATLGDASSFPGRAGYRLWIDKADDNKREVVEVGGGAGTVNLSSLTRAVDGTCDVTHDSSAPVQLAAAYAWTEQEATANGKWQNLSGGRSGTFTAEPAFDRNRSAHIPDDTFVLLWKRTEDGAGSTTLTAAVDDSTTSIPVAARDSFPQVLPFYIRAGAEYMKVTAGEGTGAGTFTVVRGQYGSIAEAHDSGITVVEGICEWVFDARVPDELTLATATPTYSDSATTPISNVRRIEADSAFFEWHKKPHCRAGRLIWKGEKFRKNNADPTYQRRQLSFIEGARITHTLQDDSGTPEARLTTAWEGLGVAKDSGANVGVRRNLNIIQGTGTTITVADDSGNDRVNVTIAASGGGFQIVKSYSTSGEALAGGGAANLEVPFNETDTHNFRDGTDDTEWVFDESGIGWYEVHISCEAEVTFSSSQVTPGVIRLEGQLDGTVVRGLEACDYIWKIAAPEDGTGTGTIAHEKNKVCLHASTRMYVDATEAVFTVRGFPHASLETVFDEVRVSISRKT